MNYSINQTINPYSQQQQAMGMSSDSSGNNSTTMGLNTSQVQDNLINTSPTVKGVIDQGGKHRWITLAAFVPVWAGMIYAMNKFNTACKGTFDESLIGRVSKWAEAKGNNSFFQSSVFKTIGEKWKAFKDVFMKKAVPKSRILNAIFKTPSKPESSMVLMMSGGTLSELAADAAQKLELLHKQTPDLLKKIGVSAEEFEKITGKSHLYKDEIIKICEKLSTKETDHFVDTKVWKIPFTNKHCSEVIPGVGHKILDVDVYFSGYANKMKAIFVLGNVMENFMLYQKKY